jgi:hypothetical protein
VGSNPTLSATSISLGFQSIEPWELAAAGNVARARAGEGATETDMEHRPVADGQHVTGIYRRSVMLASYFPAQK